MRVFNQWVNTEVINISDIFRRISVIKNKIPLHNSLKDGYFQIEVGTNAANNLYIYILKKQFP